MGEMMRDRMCVKTALKQAFKATDRSLLEAITAAWQEESDAAARGARNPSSDSLGLQHGVR